MNIVIVAIWPGLTWPLQLVFAVWTVQVPAANPVNDMVTGQ
ncbi:MAG: hypothetical protein ACREBG_03800 [Pyrinomonadaceae bacterium]